MNDSGYTLLCALDSNGNVMLMEREDGALVVRKRIENPSVYEKLVGVNHPNLPIEYGVSVVSSIEQYTYEEYISGQSLDGLLRESGKLSKKVVRSVCMEICLGLAQLHQLGIIHRDIKPEHIILTPDGKVKLIDFGAAREYRKGAATDTRHLGTKGYAAPEQYGFAQTTHKADIYAMGVLTATLLSGELPNATLENMRIPFPFWFLITQCTDINPFWRIKSARKLYKAYKHIYARLVWHVYWLLLTLQFLWFVIRALLAFDGKTTFF